MHLNRADGLQEALLGAGPQPGETLPQPLVPLRCGEQGAPAMILCIMPHAQVKRLSLDTKWISIGQ
jgi:hypothetical protein